MNMKESVLHAIWNQNNNNSEYWTRMDKSINDKSLMLEILGDVSDYRVLEIGFGNGELSNIFHKNGAMVYGIDMSKEAMKHVEKRGFASRMKLGSCFDVPALFPNVKFDIVVMCSVIHEIFSYGDGMNDVNRVLKMISSILNPGGRVIIRDMVEPENGDDKVILQLSDDWNNRAEKYMDIHPFGKRYDMEPLGNGEWFGTFRACTALMYTVNWGMESLNREAYELNQITTEKGFAAILEEYGFQAQTHSYFNEDYREHLVDDACIRTEEGVKLEYPDTNIIALGTLE